jgi:hypothetical protein
LHPGRLGDPKLARCIGGVSEQRRLADASFAVHDQHGAGPAAHAGQEPVEDRALAVPTEQLPS